jgi:DNA-binding response OmpR family regulator
MKLLLVEDEHKIAHSLKKGLEQDAYTIDLAFEAQAGLDLALTETYDVIILDRMLPGMDGLEIVKELRDANIHTPVIMLTAKGQLHDRIEGLNRGADDYLVKPFAYTELLARIQAVSRRQPIALSRTLFLDSLVLHTTTFEVLRHNISIQLTKREFSLLEYLLRHKGTILTKDKIIEDVWDYDTDILPNTIEVYIGYLRQKIDRAFPKEKPLIHTVRGFGYSMHV